MARRRIPPELRRRTWREGTVWELLVTADLLPYRFASPFADLGLRPRERRELRRETELLKTTTIAFILPQPTTERRAAQPWLYIRTKRGGHYRVGEVGEIQRYGRRTQRLGSGSITEHGWYPCALRGVRWLQLIATNRLTRKVSRQQSQEAAVADNAAPSPEQLPALQQLRLFNEP
jgi:hypothetical protein